MNLSQCNRTTACFLTYCSQRALGIKEIRFVANEGCSHEKSYDVYFEPKFFFVVKQAANCAGAELGEYQNIEEGCVTLLGQDFDEGVWKLDWRKDV